MQQTTIIGVDVSTNPKKLGLCEGVFDHESGAVSVVWAGLGGADSITTIADRIERAAGPVLLAIDAPLGWPDAMKDALQNHTAGQPIAMDRGEMFCRHTDRAIATIRKPLDVGADKLAKTAHYALFLLGELRTRLDRAFPLAWAPGERLTEDSVIEVYPAATLSARSLLRSGYKKRDATEVRRQLLDALDILVGSDEVADRAAQSDDVFDAVVCVCAGADFLQGRATSPSEDLAEIARREGWIWCRGGAPATT